MIKKINAFTLLEIIITIIIVGILASLALPRFFKTMEFARSNEALTQLGSIKRSLERCYLFESDYTACDDFNILDMEDPSLLVNTHFTYGIVSEVTLFTVTATRNSVANGDGSSTVTIDQDGVKSGTGVFTNIQ